MQIVTYPLGQMQANCYLLIQEKQCIIIDPADSADFLLEEIARRDLDVQGIFATHGHFDHIMAAGELQMSLSVVYEKHIPFYIHEDDEFLVQRAKQTAKHFLGYEPEVLAIENIDYIQEGHMSLGVFEFDVILTPGHTPGSVCFYFPTTSVIFTGDTLFKGAVGRYDFSYSRKDQLRNSLENLLKLPKKTKVYAGHGEITSIKEEEKQKEALRYLYS